MERVAVVALARPRPQEELDGEAGQDHPGPERQHAEQHRAVAAGRRRPVGHAPPGREAGHGAVEWTVIDGPFTETKEIIAGFWLIQAKSRDEALEWARRVPFEDGEVEVRQLFELEDFGKSAAVDRHSRIREKIG